MKQTSFMVEVCLNDDKPVIIVRDARGVIVKISNNPAEMSTFLEELITKMSNVNASNNEKGNN